MAAIAMEDGAEHLRQVLFESATNDDVSGMQQVCKHIEVRGLKLTDAVLRHPHSNATALQVAMDTSCWEVSKYLISSAEDDTLLTAVCRVFGTSLKELEDQGERTCFLASCSNCV